MANQFVAPAPILPSGRDARPPTLPIVYVRQISPNAQRELLIGKATDFHHVRYLDSTRQIYFLPQGLIGEHPAAFSFSIDEAGLLRVALAPESVEVHRPDDFDERINLQAAIVESRILDYRLAGASVSSRAEGTSPTFVLRQEILENVRGILYLLLRRVILHSYTPLISRITFTDPVRAALATETAERHADALTSFIMPRSSTTGFLSIRDYPDIGRFPSRFQNDRGDISNTPIPPLDNEDIRRVFRFACNIRGRLVSARDTDDATKQYSVDLSNDDFLARFTPLWYRGVIIELVAAPLTRNPDNQEIILGRVPEFTFPVLGSISPTQSDVFYKANASVTRVADLKYDETTTDGKDTVFFTGDELLKVRTSPTQVNIGKIQFRWGSEFNLGDPFDQEEQFGVGFVNFPSPPNEGDLLFPWTTATDDTNSVLGPPFAVLPTAPPIQDVGVTPLAEDGRFYKFPRTGDLITDLATGSRVFQGSAGRPPSGTEG